MIGFAWPEVLSLVIALQVGWYWFSRVQKLSLKWIDGHVSGRSRRFFTVHSNRSMRWHLRLVLILGLLLLVGAARPVRWGETEAVVSGGKVLLLVDASASMWAEDVENSWRLEDEAPPKNRLGLATRIAGELVETLDGYEFAVASYSGSAVIHLPAVADRGLVLDTLANLEAHSNYFNTGSSLGGALDVAVHFIDPDDPFLQVVILGDGEMPHEDDYGPSLEALVRSEVPVHSVVVGSLEGQGRIIFDMRDIVAGVDREEWTVLQRYTTRRVDEHLKRISRRTGGTFQAVEESLPELLMEELADGVVSRQLEARRVEHEEVATELAPVALWLFLIGFLVDALWIGRLGRRPLLVFDVDRIGATGAGGARSSGNLAGGLLLIAAALAATASGCGSSDRALAHRDNELGLAQDAIGRHDAARPHFERSIAYGEDAQIPTYNLARSVTRKGDHSEAHELYQRAMELAPEMVEAHHNDGVALYRWGKAERDPRDCELERTLELWKAARARFSTAAELAPQSSEQRERSRADHRYLIDAIREIERLTAEPPDHCQGPQGGESSASGGKGTPPPGGGDPDGQDGPDPPPAGGGGESPPPGLDESAGGASSGPLTEEELGQIRQELGRIAEQQREEGKFHRRTRPEQMHPEDWDDPEKVLWW